MPRLPAPREGKPAQVRQRPVHFSFWPTTKTTSRYGLQSGVFTTDPWNLIKESVFSGLTSDPRDEAAASIDQAQQFFVAAQRAETVSAKPLLLYYSLMNLGKAFALKSAVRVSFDKARHGLSEQLPVGGTEFVDAQLSAFTSPDRNGNANLFSDFKHTIDGFPLAANTSYEIKQLLPQIVAGHRLWCDAWKRRERFISIYKMEVMDCSDSKELWFRMHVHADSLSRLGVSRTTFINEGRLAGNWREVDLKESDTAERKLLCFEQINTIKYTGRPSDNMKDLIDTVKNNLWTVVLSVPPYRKYYVYLAPAAEHPSVLPQLCSIYCLLYYLGSVTRYRPQKFNDLLDGKYGPHILEVINGQAYQYLYLIASEFAKREVTMAAIV